MNPRGESYSLFVWFLKRSRLGLCALVLVCVWPVVRASAVVDVGTNLLAGRPVNFDPTLPESERTVAAAAIMDAAKQGANIDVENAVITGKLELEDTLIHGKIHLYSCVFSDDVDFSQSVFEQNAEFTNSVFAGDAIFDSAQCRAQFDITGAKFKGKAKFFDFVADDVFAANGAEFSDAYFEGALFSKNVSFSEYQTLPAATFSGNANFVEATFKGGANFNKCVLGSPQASVLFRKATFLKLASFRGAHFEGQIEFTDVTFQNDADFGYLADVVGARFSGDCTFQQSRFLGLTDFERVRFESPHLNSFVDCEFTERTLFSNVNFGGGANFYGTSFKKAARFSGDRFVTSANSTGIAANFSKSDFASDATFESVDFLGYANFSYARFGGLLSFNKSNSEKADSTKFHKGVNFRSAAFDSDAFFDGVQFLSTKEPATFDFSRFAGQTSFEDADFAGPVSFNQTEFGIASTFENAVFSGGEDTINFNSIRAGLFLCRKTKFLRDVDFTSASFAGNFECEGAVFGGNFDFDAVSVNGNILFASRQADSPVEFRKEVNFNSTKIGGLADLSPCQFDSDAFFKAAVFQGGLLLSYQGSNDYAQFFGEANFNNIQVNNRLGIQGVIFKTNATFLGSKWFVPVVLEGVQFDGETKFDGASFSTTVDFQPALFETNSSLSLRDVFCQTLGLPNLEKTSRQHPNAVDLTGCTYSRLEGQISHLPPNLVSRDPQTLLSLEKTLRQEGRDKEADAVYLDSQRNERKEAFKNRNYSKWFLSVCYNIVANYGVRPYRLAVLSFILIGLGCCFFRIPGSVILNEPTRPAEGEKPIALSTWEALEVAVHQFLPIAMPLGAAWCPARRPVRVKLPMINRSIPIRPTVIATFVLKIAGWTLVPLGVAALTGLLKVSN